MWLIRHFHAISPLPSSIRLQVADLPILAQLEARRFVTLYLSLVLNILLIVLCALSALLVYSLLTVSAESRTFDLAVRRMLGSRRDVVLALLLAFLAVQQELALHLPLLAFLPAFLALELALQALQQKLAFQALLLLRLASLAFDLALQALQQKLAFLALELALQALQQELAFQALLLLQLASLALLLASLALKLAFLAVQPSA